MKLGCAVCFCCVDYKKGCTPGADPGFQVRGGALKKIAPSGGRRENFWGIPCEKSRFYATKSYFSNFRGGARNFWGISCEKSRFYAKKNHIFSNFRWGARRVRPPPPPRIRPCTRFAAASGKVYQLLVHGRFSTASSTTKTGRYDIAEILLKVALNTINHQSKSICFCLLLRW